MRATWNPLVYIERQPGPRCAVAAGWRLASSPCGRSPTAQTKNVLVTKSAKPPSPGLASSDTNADGPSYDSANTGADRAAEAKTNAGSDYRAQASEDGVALGGRRRLLRTATVCRLGRRGE